jgi:hypothetical protein
MIASIISQYAEESAFLWLLRNNAVHAPHYALKNLAKLDDRIEAHPDGLRVAGDSGGEFCKEGLHHEDLGEVFAQRMGVEIGHCRGWRQRKPEKRL